ncbi:hypothetical protein [Tenacibaculum maritimum]|uniref:hypothetical protein n=1 Tax=Tenacibaculum maritimum TaxID=107401 RepID=UPI0038764862
MFTQNQINRFQILVLAAIIGMYINNNALMEKVLFIIGIVSFIIVWIANYNPTKGWLLLWELKKSLNRGPKKVSKSPTNKKKVYKKNDK